MLGAMAAHARGAVELSGGDPPAALVALRGACRAWRTLEAPYEAARAQSLVGLACVDSLSGRAASPETYGLTSRELEVLRLVAAGNSNREISAALVVSEHTVARHLQNIFAKLDVSSRTAASAFAFAHDLI
jgi:ATP/maltotriose-dependent transcriptional regulator MalT